MTWRIAITGPESTGKSELAAKLAAHYKTVWVPEYSREYLDHIGRPYIQDDIVEIAKGQLKSESEMLISAKSFLFCDTELIVTKIWSDFIFKSCDPWIDLNIRKNPYDLYLLCWIDVPWTLDPLREHPHLRELLFNMYFKELKTRNLKFEIVCGLGEDRSINAIKYLEKWFGKP